MKTLSQELAIYKKLVIPGDAGPVQIIECQRAFYAGALALNNIYLESLTENVSEAQAVMNIEQAQKDLANFFAQASMKF